MMPQLIFTSVLISYQTGSQDTFFLIENIQISSGAHPPFYSISSSGVLSQCYGGQGVKLTTDSSPYKTKIKNE